MSTIKTPDISHLTSQDFENVYEPAEDSFILLDALEIEIKKIQELKPTFALEIGPGSGIISAAIANITVNERQLKKLCFVFSCDINLSACKATQLTVNQNNVSSNVGILCSNLVQGLIHRCNQNIDLVVCNPPYVITSDEELINVKNKDTFNVGIDAAWAGGKLGCASVTYSLIQLLPKILSPKGICYIVLEHSNNPEQVGKYAETFTLNYSIILKRRAGRELLFVMKLSRSNTSVN